MTKSDIKKMFVAIEKHDHETVAIFIKNDNEALEVVGHHNANCRDKTPLMFAMQCEDFELANNLIDSGANVKAVMPTGPESSVIMLAAQFGHGLRPNFNKWLIFTQKLIDLGANPSEALWPACHAYNKTTDKSQMISLLISNEASPETRVGNSGNTVKELIKINS